MQDAPGCGRSRARSRGGANSGARLAAQAPPSLLVGYHGELKFNLFHNTRII